MSKGNILIADDDTAIRTVLHQAFSRAGYTPRITSNAATLWSWISRGDGELVITDVVMPDESAFDILPRVRKARPELPVIVMSAQNTVLTAITAAEHGVYEYLPKPFDLNELIAIAERALTEQRTAKTNRATRRSEPKDDDALPLIGRSTAMQEIYRVLARLTQLELTVLITGESGTGKELVARALHDFSKRKLGPFVAVNMGAIPQELIESELFGHEKGAFTGAQQRSIGHFEQAEGGTLFLDEIGDMPMAAQTRLLRVLQDGEYTTVGGRTPLKTDVRIVAATHRDLRQLISQGLFREDLYYRLNVVPLKMPALRDRLEDVPDLVQHFVRRGIKAGLPAREIAPDAMQRLKRYDWPGNVRELENLVNRLMALNAHDLIGDEIVSEALAPVTTRDVEAKPGPGQLSDTVEQHLAHYFAEFGDALPPPGLYQRILRQVEMPLIAAALAATAGNQIRAAELLGVNRNTLRKKIRDLDMTIVKSSG